MPAPPRRHIDFVLPEAHDLLAGFATWQAKAQRGCMDYGFHVAVTSWSARVAADMGTLVAQRGVNSFKFFLAYKGALMARAQPALRSAAARACAHAPALTRACAHAQVTDAELLAGLRRCRALGALAMVHAENGEGVEDGRAAVFAAGMTGPEGHGMSRPAVLEEEATGRAIRLAGCVPRSVAHPCLAKR
jgi:dihydropyrimidinase